MSADNPAGYDIVGGPRSANAIARSTNHRPPLQFKATHYRPSYAVDNNPTKWTLFFCFGAYDSARRQLPLMGFEGF
jgi:hypothetical protein